MNALPTIEDYINAVATVMKIKPEELGKSINLLGQPVTRNSGVFPRAREICAEAMHTTGRFSLPEIARAMGLPNHSTVITARDRLRAKMVDGKYPDDISIQLAGVEQLAHVNAQKRMENADHGKRQCPVCGRCLGGEGEQAEQPTQAPERPGQDGVGLRVEGGPIRVPEVSGVRPGTDSRVYGKAVKIDRKQAAVQVSKETNA